MSKTKQTTAQNLESRFDAGQDVSDYFDATKAVRRNHVKDRVNLDLPRWMIRQIDLLAGRNGIPRQSQIKTWIADRLKSEKAP